MSAMRATLLILLVACGTPERLKHEQCRNPSLYSPVSDTADPDAVYFGCNPPAGWAAHTNDTAGPTEDTSDTGL